MRAPVLTLRLSTIAMSSYRDFATSAMWKARASPSRNDGRTVDTGALKAATSSIPIVFVGHADPVGTGQVASLARPGGNITWVAVLQTELGPKGLGLLRRVVPSVTRVAVPAHEGTPSAVPGLKALEGPARALGLKLQPVGARTAGELESAFATMGKGRAQALLVF